MTVEGKIAAEFDFRPEIVRVVYDEPWELPSLRWRRWPRRWRLRGWRRRARAYVLRPRRLRELVQDSRTFAALADGGLDLRVGAIVGISALLLPKVALEAIWDAYCRVNLLPAAALSENDASRVTFDALLRRLERDPFNLTRESILELSAAQIAARLAEWGTEKLNDLRTQVEFGRGV